ncbi:MAG: GAF domain-containing protein [Nitrospirae bacterium]|nr:GAF domain-containing protein [Nitrospirota bacterium]
MELLALLTNRDDIIPEVKTALKKYTVYPLKTQEEFEDLHTNIPINLLLIDSGSHRLSRIGDLLGKMDNDTVILITPEKLDRFAMGNLPPSIFDCIHIQEVRAELLAVTERALDKQRLKNLMTLLKPSKDNFIVSEAENEDGLYAGQQPGYRQMRFEGFPLKDDFSEGKSLQKKALVNFAKMLTVSFDMRKLFNHFMDSVAEIIHVSKMSVMLKDKDGFYIKTHYGLDPYIADNLRLKKDSALVIWLARTGRIRHKPLSPGDTASVTINKEMEFLQCSFSFPLLHKGKLIGIFNIDNKITEEPFYREELEIIYVLCNYLAAAVKDIDLYHQIRYQKEFTKNILSSMTSGVIAIDKDEKITVFNQQAGAILDMNPAEMLGCDLRSLPSPLGDLLYETMTAGTTYRRYEAEILEKKLPVGINSYKLLDEGQSPAGAGIVFSDLSDFKGLEEQKRRVERLETMNDLMAKIAHEVRNPMTSIYTYTQLLHDKYKDEDLNNFYTTAVFQAIHKLDSLIDKLVIFSSKPEYNLGKEDLNSIIDESADYIKKTLPELHKFSKQNFDMKVFVQADRKLLAKAICYLIFNAIDMTPKGAFIYLGANNASGSGAYAEISIKYNGVELSDKERQDLLKPLVNIDNLGSELNIPISRKIIEEHNGSLDLKSEQGANSFVIRLPVIDRIEELTGSKSVTYKGGDN